MTTRVRADERYDRRRETDQAGKACVTPACVILELKPRLSNRCALAHDPEDDEDGKKASHVQPDDKVFYKRQFLKQKDVDRNSNDGNGHG